MARKEDMSNDGSDNGDSGVFALNDTRIGRYGDNKKRSDIQLVQFFLKQFYRLHPAYFRMLPQTRSKAAVIVIDGKYGKQTEEGIIYFQLFMQKKGIPIKPDGLVSVPHSLRGPNSNTVYTIHRLNHYFKLNGEHKEYHGRLEDHPDIVAFAPELRAELASAAVRNDF